MDADHLVGSFYSHHSSGGDPWRTAWNREVQQCAHAPALHSAYRHRNCFLYAFGAMDGIRFLFHPDFSKINRSVFLDALGQSFFSLSLGTACLCTYSSYFSRRTKLLNSAAQIAGLDSLIAILAGLMIFPAAFSVGVQPDSGPSLIFITLPNVFQQAFTPTIGYLIAILSMFFWPWRL